MTWNEFYMQTTGSNLNSGSTNSDTASVTSTNGNWNATTGVFTAASGTPFTSVTVGEWASIHLDAAAATPFVGQITAVTSNTITVSLTVKVGTVPATGTTGRTCRIGGAWANLALVGTLTGAVGMPFRMNIKAGTYANTTTSRTFNYTGSNANPVWVRGYNTIIGDLDDNSSGTKPLFTFTTGLLTLTLNFGIFSNIEISSARTTGTAVSLTTNVFMDRCIIENTGVSSTAYAVQTANNGNTISRCWLRTTSTADYTILVGHVISILGNWIEGRSATSIIEFSGGGGGVVIGNVIVHDSSTSGCCAIRIFAALNQQVIMDNTIHMTTSGTANKIGIYIDSEPGILQSRFWANNIITGTDSSRHTAMTIAGSLTAGLDALTIMNNYFQGVVTTSGVSDFASGDRKINIDFTDVSSPYTNAATKDFSLTSSNNALYNGFPTSFKFGQIINYKDIGAVQTQTVDSSTAGLRRIGLEGGL